MKPNHLACLLVCVATLSLGGCGGGGEDSRASAEANRAAPDVSACTALESGTALIDGNPLVVPAGAHEKPLVVPTLRTWQGTPDIASVTPLSRIVLAQSDASGLQPVAMQLVADIKALTGWTLPIVHGKPAAPGDVLLSRQVCNANVQGLIGEEGYTLDAGNLVSIRANSPRGIFYGTRTLLQMMLLGKSADGSSSAVSGGYTVDYPRYGTRALQLDVARKYLTPAFIQQYIRFMSWYKLNTLHLYLNDGVNDPSGKVTATQFRLASDNPAFASLKPTDGLAYTRADWDGFEDLAARHAVEILPEIESVGHTAALVAARPDLAAAGPNQYGSETVMLDIGNPASLAYVESVWSEFLPWFRSSRVHIGGDELLKSVMDQPSAVGTYINGLASFLKKNGKQVAIWDLPTVESYYDKSLLVFRWNFEGTTSTPLWGRDGFQYLNSPHEWYIVPGAPARYNPNGIPGESLYDAPDQSLNPGDLAPIGGQLSNWNDQALNSPYSEATLNHILKDSVAPFGQIQWSGQDVGAGGQVTPYARIQQSIGRFQYGPDATLFVTDQLTGQ
ncbi:family 20 glycosylhydrolase [Burkholderia pseudomultivorans]|uniref:family 20 glycosylhydrolase n=1 Tax=Burkholderia pseudomultivorans TaxID=1207504 RepID=UPI0007C6B718|nr:family 20 glycosylhydrolase [Burkholderia pseudomultivorans]